MLTHHEYLNTSIHVMRFTVLAKISEIEHGLSLVNVRFAESKDAADTWKQFAADITVATTTRNDACIALEELMKQKRRVVRSLDELHEMCDYYHDEDMDSKIGETASKVALHPEMKIFYDIKVVP